MKAETIFVTGATGFIGRRLVEALAYQYKIIAIARPQSSNIPSSVDHVVIDNDTNKIPEAFSKYSPIGVVHLASLFLSKHKYLDISSLIDSNLCFPTRLLEAATNAGTKWFLNTGTFWQNYEDHSYCPVNLYSATKEAFVTLARYYTETHPEFNFVTLKINDTYGPGDTRKKIMNLWLENIKTKTPLLMSPGKQLIDIVHIEDIISAYIKLIELINSESPLIKDSKEFGISSFARIPLVELASVFEEVTGKKLNIKWGALPYREREVMEPWKKFKTIPDWSPKITLEQGIRSLLETEKSN